MKVNFSISTSGWEACHGGSRRSNPQKAESSFSVAKDRVAQPPLAVRNLKHLCGTAALSCTRREVLSPRFGFAQKMILTTENTDKEGAFADKPYASTSSISVISVNQW
jgi:hypothetical protein